MDFVYLIEIVEYLIFYCVDEGYVIEDYFDLVDLCIGVGEVYVGNVYV